MDKLAIDLQVDHSEYQDDQPKSNLEQAILRAVAYADVFNYPLTPDEIARWLVEFTAPEQNIRLATSRLVLQSRLLGDSGKYITLAGREHLGEVRQAREAYAASLWPQANKFGALIARLPYVRMVAVTGALAVNNVEPGADIDYLIVTEPGRLWVCRAFVILVVRRAALSRVTLCPNFFISSQALEIAPRDLYTAHEIIQMVPLSGFEVYRRLRLRNQWTDRLLPNATNAHQLAFSMSGEKSQFPPLTKSWGERVLNHPLGRRIDRWEMERKMRKFARIKEFDEEFNFSPDWCRGHRSGHAGKTREAYRARLAQLRLTLQRDLMI
jgi:hypothetical protein